MGPYAVQIRRLGCSADYTKLRIGTDRWSARLWGKCHGRDTDTDDHVNLIYELRDLHGSPHYAPPLGQTFRDNSPKESLKNRRYWLKQVTMAPALDPRGNRHGRIFLTDSERAHEKSARSRYTWRKIDS